MAIFSGTNREFKRYVGPRLRNLVQSFTKRHKGAIAACEHCGGTDHLESAHVNGRDRNGIIELIAAKYAKQEVITVDLRQFEKDFKAEHQPIEKSILILCRDCHRKYDSSGRSYSSPKQSAVNQAGLTEPARTIMGGILPISLDPPQLDVFKDQLLFHRRAEIVIFYSDGRTEPREWNASRFSRESNVFGNLRSRPDFRQGKWQAQGIVKVHVRVGKGT